MKKLRVVMGLAASVLAVLWAGAVVRGQDDWDDDSLFAAEDVAIDEAVTGSLPEGEEQNEDDLFDSLFGDAEEEATEPDTDELEDLEFSDEELDAGAFDDIEETGDAFESVDADAAFPEELEETAADAGTDAEALDDFDAGSDQTADEVLDEMMAAGDEELAADTATEAGFEDLFGEEAAGEDAMAAEDTPADEVDAGAEDDFDALFGEMTAEEPTVDVADVAEVDEPAAEEEAPEAEDDFDALFGGMTDEEPTEDAADVAEVDEPADKGAPEAEDDFDALFGEMTDEEPTGDDTEAAEVAEPAADEVPEAEDDLDALFGDVAEEADTDGDGADVAEPAEDLAAAETTAEPAAPEPEYEDELALDAGLFAELAREGRQAAREAPPEAPREPAPAPSRGTEPERGVAEPEPEQTDIPAEPEQTDVPAEPEQTDIPAETAAARTPRPAGVASLEETERMRRIARENHAVNSLARAEEAMKGREYRRAIRMFEEALRYLSRRADLEPSRARARRGLAAAYFRQSQTLERMQDYEAALEAAETAVRHGHKGADEAVARIKALMEDPPSPPPTPRAPRWKEEEFQRIDKEIEDWLTRGREAYLTGEYERAILAFESVLARDPENKEAIRMMRAASNRQYDRSTMELDATRARMVASVRETWNPRQYGLHEEPIDTELTETTTGRPEEEIQRLRILEKMESIRIPEVNFRQANIRDVVTFLQQQSVEFDPAENRADRTGVNIILKMKQGDQQGGAAASEPESDFFAAPSEPSGGGEGGGDSLITFSALDVTLKEALDIVVDVANLKYRIRGNVVMLLPQDAAEGDIEHRMYDVLPSAISRLQELSTAVTGGGGSNRRGGAGDFLALEGSDDAGGGEDIDLKGFFSEMGVEWPARSSIKFVRGLGKLVVANTQENLAVFEKVLSILNVVPYQIEIEARFVEVAQTDVDSLGLEWMLTDAWEIAEMAADAGKSPAARRRVVMDANSDSGGFTSGNRFLTDAEGSGPLGANIMDDVLSVSSVLTNPELSMVLHALQQRGHTDLLSAPKITTQSGQQATIKVVTEYIYPTAFETQGIESGTTGGDTATAGTVGAVVTPLDFATREVGVILEVLPEVSPEGQMINLMLAPEVVSEPTWRNFGSTFTSFDPLGNPIEQQLNMEQPFFHTRKLRTNLLIYNGATVVMGGMITEVRNTVDDKVPLLGDVPVLGRLFRSQYDSSEKRNLLIFVTARLVDPSGRALDKERLGVDQSIAERIVTAE